MRIFVLGVLCPTLWMGVNCNVDEKFVNAIDRAYTPIEQDYKGLLKDKSGYDADTIRIRTQTADELRKLIEEAKKKK